MKNMKNLPPLPEPDYGKAVLRGFIVFLGWIFFVMLINGV